MALTEITPVPLTSDSDPERHDQSPVRSVGTWVAVVAALAASVVLAVQALEPHAEPRKVDMTHTVAEHGSVAAIDHRDQLEIRRYGIVRSVAEHGSISAIDHRDRLGLRD
jgi:hypothetical protein